MKKSGDIHRTVVWALCALLIAAIGSPIEAAFCVHADCTLHHRILVSCAGDEGGGCCAPAPEEPKGEKPYCGCSVPKDGVPVGADDVLPAPATANGATAVLPADRGGATAPVRPATSPARSFAGPADLGPILSCIRLRL